MEHCGTKKEKPVPSSGYQRAQDNDDDTRIERKFIHQSSLYDNLIVRLQELLKLTSLKLHYKKVAEKKSVHA